jgi:cysteinyl-tRNA synthetase
MVVNFYNTLSRKKELFTSISPKEVKMYSCGPTVYDYAHIGNLRAYVFTDILRRTLEYRGYRVKQIMNLTDLGHLSSDGDSGEDKMTKGLLREGKTLTLKNMKHLAKFYAKKFKEDLRALNIKLPTKMLFASDYIKEDIKLLKKLEIKNYTYKTSDGIYFDISKMPDYGILWGGKRIWNEDETRILKNPEKRNPEDFALWKFSAEGGSASGGNIIGFPSPWGKGFPGWHIECSALSLKTLGEQFDIHTGGVEHIPIHHTNEIAQSECATGKKPFVRFWLHNEWVLFDQRKMAKSDGSFVKLNDLKEKNINPLAYRLLILMANYGSKINFNWEALEGAEIALGKLSNLYLELGKRTGKVSGEYNKKFIEFIEDDLDTPKAIVLLWELLKDEKISPADKKATILDFDRVLGLDFKKLKKGTVPKEIEKLAREREQARQNKDFQKSDELRTKINSLGYEIKDTDLGSKISKI